MFGFNRPFVSSRRYVATHPGDPDYDDDAPEETLDKEIDEQDDEPEVGEGPHDVDDRGWP